MKPVTVSSFWSVTFIDCGQISLLEMPDHKKKKMMTMTSNVMRDESDKVKTELVFYQLSPYVISTTWYIILKVETNEIIILHTNYLSEHLFGILYFLILIMWTIITC